jgi:hypothetical protein
VQLPTDTPQRKAAVDWLRKHSVFMTKARNKKPSFRGVLSDAVQDRIFRRHPGTKGTASLAARGNAPWHVSHRAVVTVLSAASVCARALAGTNWELVNDNFRFNGATFIFAAEFAPRRGKAGTGGKKPAGGNAAARPEKRQRIVTDSGAAAAEGGVSTGAAAGAGGAMSGGSSSAEAAAAAAAAAAAEAAELEAAEAAEAEAFVNGRRGRFDADRVLPLLKTEEQRQAVLDALDRGSVNDPGKHEALANALGTYAAGLAFASNYRVQRGVFDETATELQPSDAAKHVSPDVMPFPDKPMRHATRRCFVHKARKQAEACLARAPGACVCVRRG